MTLMAVASTTLCYPTPRNPTRGIFVKRRLEAIHRLSPLKVIAPVPWFPGLRRYTTACDTAEFPPVWRPRMLCVPRFFKRRDAWWYSRALRRGISEAFGCRAPDLIDAHFEWPDAVGAAIVARSMNVPLVITLRGKLVSQSRDPIRREMMAAALRSADSIISVSASLADLAAHVAGRSLEVRVIPNGVDTAVFHPRPPDAARCELGLDAAARIVVSVGHWQEIKGFDRLVSIWPELRRRVGGAKLVLIGGDAGEKPYERRLRREIDRLGLSGDVQLLGRRPPEQVASYLAAADLFALWSRSEGRCNAMVEALCCGCPVVASDVGGNAETITDRSLGRLVAFDDAAAWTDAIADALRTEWDRDRIARHSAGRRWRQVAEECLEVWNGVWLGRTAVRKEPWGDCPMGISRDERKLAEAPT